MVAIIMVGVGMVKVQYLIGWQDCLDVCVQLQLGGGPALTCPGLSLVGRLQGGWGIVKSVWAAKSVWGGLALARPVFLLVGRLWGGQGFVGLDWLVAGSAAVTITIPAGAAL